MTISLGRVESAEQAAWPRLPLTFATLMTALRSGNLAAAREAYGDLQTSLQPHLGSLIAPVGAALGNGETAQAGRVLGQLRGVIAAATTVPGATPTATPPGMPTGTSPDTGTNTGSGTPQTVVPTALVVPTPAAAAVAAAFDRLV